MKRTLALLLATVAGTALAQTPTVVEQPAVKPAIQTKAAPKAPAQNSKGPVTAVKVVAVSAQKPVVVAAKPSSAPAAKSAAVSAAKPSAAPIYAMAVKSAAVPAAKPAAVSVQAAKPVAVSAAKSSAPSAAKPVAVAVPGKPMGMAPAAHVAVVAAKPAVQPAPKPVERSVKSVMVPVKVNSATEKAGNTPVAVPVKTAEAPQGPVAVQDTKADAEDKTAKSISPVGHRDPFVSPVVNMGSTGSGCSSGKRCLAIDEVALKGVVKSEAGMIAVVVNSLDKAYFLRENDPVFNGYVLKITDDSVVFKETFRDKLGKPLTRDVTKSIARPVA